MLVRIVGASNEIVRARLADAAEQALTATPDVEETWPYWSAPARRLVYVASTDGVSHDLHVWDPERRAAAPITRTPNRDEQWPVWSPRRPQLVFAFRGGSPPGGLMLAELPRLAPRLLAVSGEHDLYLRPSFAPDGASLVVQRRGADSQGSLLWKLAPGSPAQPLTSDPAWVDIKPVYDRAGREIFFSRRPAAGGPFDILALPAQGGAPRTLCSTPASNDHSAQPSPRRDEFVFVSDREGRSALYLAPTAGGTPRRLGSDPARNHYAPHWSPDGERVVAIATPAGVGRPTLAEPEALAETHVVVFDREGRVLFDAPGFMPDWMPPWREP